MTQHYASAYPRKVFFIQMFTKDISLEDCVLDLIDNSVDGLIRSTNMQLSSISESIFSEVIGESCRVTESRQVTISYSADEFCIEDNCGGIDFEHARTEAFNFGHGADRRGGYLGVYGVGLKRALFKIGNHFHIESHTAEDGFSCELSVPEWLKKDDSPDDWRIPLTPLPAARCPEEAGTKITITDLHDEVKMVLEGGTIESSLYSSIARTYSFFLKRHVQVSVNGGLVQPFEIPLGRPEEGTASFEEICQDEVKIRLFATVARRDEKGHYSQESAGWYVVCNGRVVLPADKSNVTGWGSDGMPTFQPKHRSFVGVVFFESENPLLLPWTTTKRGLNRESAVYLRVRNRMVAAARPVISFLNRQYPSDQDTEPTERKIARGVKKATFEQLMSEKSSVFSAPKPKKRSKPTTRVQFDADDKDLDAVRQHLRKPSMPANRIGEHTFRYFLDQEGLS